MSRRLGSGLLAVIGFILSPLSWWNDLLVNVPLAYLFSIPFTWLDDRLYLPAFIVGYWLTNVVGMLLLQTGATALLRPGTQMSARRQIVVATLYTLLIGAAAAVGWLPSPAAWLP